MDLLNTEQTLPGSVTQIMSATSAGHDRSQFGSTDSVVIIGTAFDGPVGVPIEIYDPQHAVIVFGKVYDNQTRKEATLTAGIQDAYQKGSRTIYGVRVSGQEVAKTFDLALSTPLQLKVAGANPSNVAKDCVFLYDDTTGSETVRIFKPASRATTREKSEGLVEHDNAVMVTTIRINRDLGITKSSPLADLIRAVNRHIDNNVIRLSITDEAGRTLTEASAEARQLPVGALFPGAYFVGRDESLCAVSTKIKYEVFTDAADAPFEMFQGSLLKTIVLNTDVASSYPIHSAQTAALQAILTPVNITMSTMFDFLRVAGVSERAFKKDAVDYEEVDLSKFEIYKRLGSGFATTAKVVRSGDNSFKRMETPVTDPNRTMSIINGVYSMLENLNARYRVLSCGTAEDRIEDAIPGLDAFKIALPQSKDIFNGMVRATAKKESLTIDEKAKAYSFKMNDITTAAIDLAKAGLYDTKVFPILAAVPSTGAENDIVIVGGKLHKWNAGSFQAMASIAGFGDKTHVLAVNNRRVFVMEMDDSGLDVTVTPIGDVDGVFSKASHKTLAYATRMTGEALVNEVIVSSTDFTVDTLEEFVAKLNDHVVLKELFTFEMTQDGLLQKDESVAEAIGAVIEAVELAADRLIESDTTMYIPYKTGDNFARQLAQHCVYTSMKNSIPAHGIIGCTLMSDIGLTNIARKVDELTAMDFDLYAKRENGRNMLDQSNMPYPIGRALSVVFAQDRVVMNDGYSVLSNGAAGYAGMACVLPLDQSSTNQPVANLNAMFELTNYQLGRLTQRGIVTFKRSYNRGMVVTDGVTMAPGSSPFRRLSVSRIVGAVEELIREASEPFIGRQNNAANRNSLQTALKSRLDKIKGSLIERYDFRMNADPRIAKFAYIDIDYDIVPIYEIRQVRNRVTIKDEL